MDKVDAIVIGAGAVGLAVAAALSRILPNVLVVDKNSSFGEETSSRNSEVIHAGIYYPQHSLKAECCVEGKHALYTYCEQRNIPHKKIGKFIVAQTPEEEAYLDTALSQARANGVDDVTRVTKSALVTAEPLLCATAGLLSPSTGILDVHSYMESLLAEVEANNGQFIAQTLMESAAASDCGFNVTLNSQGEKITLVCRYLINSAGLHSESVARSIDAMATSNIPTVHWCRGHYFSYRGKSPFSRLIYPVPEASGAGLGIHATLDLGGQLKFGPDTEYIDHLAYGVSSDLAPKFIDAIQRYYPALDMKKLHPAYSGIRPKVQALGEGVRDFEIQGEEGHGVKGLVNLFGIESPGITASLAIAKRVIQALYLGGDSSV